MSEETPNEDVQNVEETNDENDAVVLEEGTADEATEEQPVEDTTEQVTAEETLKEDENQEPPSEGAEEEAKETETVEEADTQATSEISETGDQIQEESVKSEKELEEPQLESKEEDQPEDKPDSEYAKGSSYDTGSLQFDVESGLELLEEEELESHPLDELTDHEVIDLVQEIETENRHLYLENILFESFLRENDPSLLEGIEEIMTFLLSRAPVSFASGRDRLGRNSSTLDKNKFKLDSYTSITSIAEGKGPKINLSQKTDMVMRAMEESQSSLEAFLKKCHIIKRNLKSELEEFSIRESEIKEATEIFEFNVVIQGLDKLTQRIPAEKFIRYMEEWLKSAQLQIEKLRLRIATLKVQYKKVSQQLIQRQELGENVHAVDFDQLEIENKHFIEKIEQKNVHLIELKKMNGGANLILSTHKKFLQKQQEDCNKLKRDIDEKNKQIAATEKECVEAEKELNAEIEKYENCKNLKNQYTVPDVLEYVRLKGKLHELKKNIKIWVRRRKIQDIALNTCLREMKNLTGTTEIDPSWFEDNQSVSEGSLSEDMLL